MEKNNPPEWAILDTYGYTPVEVVRETELTVFYKKWNTDRTKFKERPTRSALPWRGSEAEARAISEKLKSAWGERARRVQDAENWFRNRMQELAGKF